MSEDAPGWDPAAAEAETRASLLEILAETGLDEGTIVTLDLRFEAGRAADRASFVAAMRAEGYRGHTYEAAGREEIEARLPEKIPLTADRIWAEERRAAQIALAHGYEPMGWGFEAP
ncbi:MAG: hypothetical protein AAF675_11175 [Pseudomonadota bacterium]